jgi:hypothetical protein
MPARLCVLNGVKASVDALFWTFAALPLMRDRSVGSGCVKAKYNT